MASRCAQTPRRVATVAILIAAVAVVGGVELTLKPFGREFYKALGDAMVFTCELELSDEDSQSDVAYTIQWFVVSNNREITDRTGRRYVEDETLIRKLYITQIQSTDAGSYRCRATRGDFRAEKQVNLKIYKPITFDSADSPQHPRIYSDALVKCVVSGSPKPEISWRYKGKRMTFGGRYQNVTNGLRIRNATLDDDGVYTCRAEVESDGRYDERKITVAVHIPPEMLEGPDEFEGIEGEEANISCNASGTPNPTFSFYKGGERVVGTSRVEVNASTGIVLFKPVMETDGHRRYNCTATNDVGSDSTILQLRVLVRPHIEELRDIQQEEYERAVLQCRSKGSLPLHMTFHKVGQEAPYELDRNENGRKVSLAAPGRLQLTIYSLMPSDAGQYRCTSVNDIGQHNATANITVLYKPRFAHNHETERYIWAMKTRNMTCSPLSEPAPTFEWQRNGQRLNTNDTFRIFTSGKVSKLQVTVRPKDQTWIYGIYTCVATNRHGMAEIRIDLKRATAPGQPTMVNMTQCMPDSVVITVTPPEDNGGMPVTGYSVQYDGNTYDYNTGDDIRIVNLKPSTKYALEVRAKNEVGPGPPYTLNIETERVRRPYPIEINSKPDGERSTQYYVTWNSPFTGGRPITKYEFTLAEVRRGGDQNEGDENRMVTINDTPMTPIRHHQLDGLKPDTQYKLTVRARNDLGWSDESPEFIFRTAPAGSEVVDTGGALGPSVVALCLGLTLHLLLPSVIFSRSSHLLAAAAAAAVV